MKRLFLIILLVICSNFVTKAWCVLCVREKTAAQLLTEEDNHNIYFHPNVWLENRTMLQDVTVTNRCIRK